MGRRKSSGFFETIIKSALGTGTTVHYKSDWLGRKQKVVTHHDSGKTKTYTHGCGFLGTTTKTKTTKNGRVVEEGKVKKNLLWGATETAQRTDGTQIERKYSPGILRDHVTTHVHGQCFKCEGTGRKTLSCRICNGTGSVHLKAKQCFQCKGTGKVKDRECKKCKGSGLHKPECNVSCRRCDGRGTFEVTCNRCGGSGSYSKTTRT